MTEEVEEKADLGSTWFWKEKCVALQFNFFWLQKDTARTLLFGLWEILDICNVQYRLQDIWYRMWGMEYDIRYYEAMIRIGGDIWCTMTKYDKEYKIYDIW